MISPMGTGAWAWGTSFFWGFGSDYGEAEVREAYNISRAAGINLFDTAEAYGSGASERLLGKFIQEHSRHGDPTPLIATKYMPYPWRLKPDQLMGALRRSLERLEVPRLDLYQIHWPFPPRPVETWVSALADALESGLARSGGVSNYSPDQTRRAHAVLTQRGFSLASNQVDYSLLNRQIERNGTLELCRDLGITVIAYSPLAQGLLTGKYSPANPPPGVRSLRYRRDYLARIQPLIQRLQDIGRECGDKTASQVALNWTICKGTVPIPGAKNGRQAQDNAGALGWRLAPDQVRALDKASQEL